MATLDVAEREMSGMLHRAALIRLLALGFAEPRAGHREAVLGQFHRVGAVDDLAEGQPWTGEYRAAHRAWNDADPEAVAMEYARLFRCTAPCPPYETAYGDGRRAGGRPVELADINGFYRAFGMTLANAEPDMPDHVSTELEFHGVLLLKLAYARARGEHEHEEITRRAALHFLEDHLGRWPGAFRQALEAHGAGAPFPQTVRLVEVVMHQECRRFGANPTLAEGRIPLGLEQAAEAPSCPMAPQAGGCHPTAQWVDPPSGGV